MDNDATSIHGGEVFVFTETITVAQGHVDDVLEMTVKSAELLRGQPGLLQYMVTKSEKSGREICSTVVWENKLDFQNFVKSDAVAALLKSGDMANIKSWMSDYKSAMSHYVPGWHPHKQASGIHD